MADEGQHDAVVLSQPAPMTSDGSEIMALRVDVHGAEARPRDGDDLRVFYDIDATAAWIVANGFERVALQFPDELLGDADVVYGLLERRLAELRATPPDALALGILGDTSYGSCCVDEVAADHMSADAVVHYGRACLSPIMRHPVRFVFGRRRVDVAGFAAALAGSALALAAAPCVALLIDLPFVHASDALAAAAREVLGAERVRVSTAATELWPPTAPVDDAAAARAAAPASDATRVVRCGGARCSVPAAIADASLVAVYVGNTETRAFSNMMLEHSTMPVLSFDPDETQQSQLSDVSPSNRALFRRYYMMENARNAEIVGIVVGTLGISGFRDAVEQMRADIRAAGKKPYTFVVGKLNPAKLANFAEIDVFVLIACPENSLLDTRDFFRPIITPFELDVALSDKQWRGEYNLDFRSVYVDRTPGASDAPSERGAPADNGGGGDDDDGGGDDDESDVRFSFITGRLYERKRPTLSDDTRLVVRTAADVLAVRSFRGLDIDAPSAEPMAAVEGDVGIASGYDNEGTAERGEQDGGGDTAS